MSALSSTEATRRIDTVRWLALRTARKDRPIETRAHKLCQAYRIRFLQDDGVQVPGRSGSFASAPDRSLTSSAIWAGRADNGGAGVPASALMARRRSAGAR
jgi:hypothetical protein